MPSMSLYSAQLSVLEISVLLYFNWMGIYTEFGYSEKLVNNGDLKSPLIYFINLCVQTNMCIKIEKRIEKIIIFFSDISR